MQGASKKGYDGEILKAFNLETFSGDEKKFIVFHLMGSHSKFEDRYPFEYQKYMPEDYAGFKDYQREVIANYDNSILYNDYVVFQILNSFSDEETLAFYFSDHGIDLYGSSDNYYGHAIQGNAASEEVSLSIPFMVYCSEKFQQSFPHDIEIICKDTCDLFETETFLEYLMCLLGIDCESI